MNGTTAADELGARCMHTAGAKSSCECPFIFTTNREELMRATYWVLDAWNNCTRFSHGRPINRTGVAGLGQLTRS